MNRPGQGVRESLSHVYWVGGGAAAGKSTVSQRLCKEFGFTRWDADGRWIEHWQTATSERNPVAFRIGSTQRHHGSFDWLYDRTGQEIAQDYQEMARVEFVDAIDELLQMPRDAPIVVDAFLGFPELVLQVARPEKAVFLICTDVFMRQIWKQRTTEGEPGFLPILRQQLDTCSDPDFALERFIESNLIENRMMADDCERKGATLILTCGNMGPEEAYSAVKRHFRLDQSGQIDDLPATWR